MESEYKKFETEYQAHINAIKSLCYASEINLVNYQMKELFSKKFESKTENDIKNLEDYIEVISSKSDIFDKKYSDRLYKGLIEAEYRITLLKLMNDINKQGAPKRNPFAGFSDQKKKIFETYLSKDIKTSSDKYNEILNSEEKYTSTNVVLENKFRQMDEMAATISERITRYSIDDFLITELLENGEGYETLQLFLKFKLKLNDIDSKTEQANQKYSEKINRQNSNQNTSNKRKSNNFPRNDWE